MKSLAKLLVAVTLVVLPHFGGGTVGACCSADTHCDLYTDNTFTSQCGTEDWCIDCSCGNQRDGCTSFNKQCVVYGACGDPHYCYTMIDGTTYAYGC